MPRRCNQLASAAAFLRAKKVDYEINLAKRLHLSIKNSIIQVLCNYGATLYDEVDSQ